MELRFVLFGPLLEDVLRGSMTMSYLLGLIVVEAIFDSVHTQGIVEP